MLRWWCFPLFLYEGVIQLAKMQLSGEDTSQVVEVKDKAAGVNVKSTEGIIPVDVQSRYATTIQTHSGVSALPNVGNASGWIDSYVDGTPLTFLAVSVNMTSGTGMRIAVDFSHDGVNYFSFCNIYDGTLTEFATDKDIQLPARYFRIKITNKDATNPKTTSAYATLKA